MIYVFLTVLIAALAAAYAYIFKFNRSLQARFWARFSLIALLAIVAVAVFNLSFERLRHLRVDLTRNRVYTVSPYTAKILRGLKAPVQVTYYVSPNDKMPTQMKTLERDVRDKLEEMKVASGGRFLYKVVPVDAQSKLAERLAQRNIAPKRIQSIDSDEWSLRTAYSSLEISYLQQDPEVVEFIEPGTLNNLEYELASRIFKLTFHADTTDYGDDQIFTSAAARGNLYPRMPGPATIYYVDTIEQNAAKLPERLSGIREGIINRLKALADGSGGKIAFKAPEPQQTGQLLFVLTRRGLLEGVPAKGDTPTVDLTKGDAAQADPEKDKDQKIYSGVYMNLYGQFDETVPLVDSGNLERLEIEIHKKIAKKLNRARPKVAIHSPRQAMDPQRAQMMMMMGQRPEQEDRYRALQEILRNENYDVAHTAITRDSPIPADAQTLVVVAPNALTERQVYEIEKFLHQGRNLIVAAQRHSFEFMPAPGGGMSVTPMPQENRLDATLKAWGVEIAPQILMDRNMEIINVSVSRPVNLGGFRATAQSVELVKHPVLIRLTDGSFPGDLSFGNRVARLLYFGGAMLKLDEAKIKSSGITHAVVARASRESWTTEGVSGPLPADAPTDPARFLDRPALAVLLSGRFPATMKEREVPLHMKEGAQGAPPEPDQESKEENQIVGEPKESKVLVIGCSELFKDDFMSDTNHQIFFLNCVDALTLGEDLIHVRAKLAAEGSLKTTTEGEKTFWKFFVIGLVPLVLAVVGTVVVATSALRGES